MFWLLIDQHGTEVQEKMKKVQQWKYKCRLYDFRVELQE